MQSSPIAIGMLNDVCLGDLIKILAWHNMGLCLFAKRLERGRFVWPSARDGVVSLTPAQLSMLPPVSEELPPG